MKLKLILLFIIFITINLAGFAQQTPVAKADSVAVQDTIDFIKKTNLAFPITTMFGKGSYIIINDIKYTNGKILVFLNGHDGKNKVQYYMITQIDPNKVIVMKPLSKVCITSEEEGSITSNLVGLKTADDFVATHDIYDMLINKYDLISHKYGKAAESQEMANFALLISSILKTPILRKVIMKQD